MIYWGEHVVFQRYKNFETQKTDHLYFAGRGKWVTDPSNAKIYKTWHSACVVKGMMQKRLYEGADEFQYTYSFGTLKATD